VHADRQTTSEEARTGEDARFLRLHPDDNVLTAIMSLVPGTKVLLDHREVSITGSVPLGHKVASRRIQSGEKIIKYGVPIGSATRDIEIGEHVHVQNLKSDYLPTQLRRSDT